jgi:hypothetical protein
MGDAAGPPDIRDLLAGMFALQLGAERNPADPVGDALAEPGQAMTWSTVWAGRGGVQEAPGIP